jgi:hypothetical protein
MRLPRRLIDISVPLKAGIRSDPPHMLPQIEYLDHRQTAPLMADYMGLRLDQFPEGEYAAVERVQISTHNGTHLDAPYHYFARMNERLRPGGEPSWRIDEVPLDWCFQPGVRLDFRHFPDGYVCTPQDVEAELWRIGHELRPLEIDEHPGWEPLRRRRLRRFRLRHGEGGHAMAAGTRDKAGRHRRMELGCAVQPYQAPDRGNGRCRPVLGGASRWA